MQLLPVFLGALVAALAVQLAGGEARGPALAAGSIAALAALAFALAYATARAGVSALVRARGDGRVFRRYVIAGRVLWLVLLGLFGLALDVGGGAALAREAPPELGASALAGSWLVVCFATWTGAFLGERRAFGGTQRLGHELRSRARRILVPVVALGALAFVVNRATSAASVRELLDLYPHARALAFGASVLLLFALGPLVVRTLAPSAPLDPGVAGALPPWLSRAAGKLSFRDWDLGFPVATASISGLFRGARTVFVTRELRAVLDEEELVAVVGHEVGHAALGHLGARAAFAVGLVLVLDDAAGLVAELLPGSLALQVAATLGALGLVATGFIALARRLEHDADLYSAERSGGAVVVNALAKACRTNGIEPDRGGILHPSPRRRIELVRRAELEPELARRRLARSSALVRGVLALAALAVVATGVGLRRDLARSPRDRLLRAADERLANGDLELARGYVERALAAREDARALVLRARTRPASERAGALDDLARAERLGTAAERAAIERARAELSLER